MSGTDTNLAAAALAIALVALITALGQLLQQYFATADGYRRCQKSVMGDYAKRTRLRWRWREFRFETLYTIPEIFLAGDGALDGVGQVLLTGSTESREKSFVSLSSMPEGTEVVWRTEAPMISDLDRHRGVQEKAHQRGSNGQVNAYRGEMSCWIPLLHRIHNTTEKALHSCFLDNGYENTGLGKLTLIDTTPPGMRLPAVNFRELSWDFQPPEAIRPLAKTTLSDIAVIARRMGMKWKDFRPSDGILRAEGHCHVITSTVIRSLGIVLQYTYTGQHERLRQAEHNLGRNTFGSIPYEQEENYIPRARADRLGCGVIRSEFDLPDITVSTQQEIIAALSYLDTSGVSSAALTNILKEHHEFRFRVGDLVALISGPIRLRGSSLVQIPAPSDNMHGVTTSPIGRKAFHRCLEECFHGDVATPIVHKVLKICRDLGSTFAAWDLVDNDSKQQEGWVVERDPRFLDVLQDHIREFTVILLKWEDTTPLRYHRLLQAHIQFAMFCADGKTSLLRSYGTDYKADVEGYFKTLPEIVEDMQGDSIVDEQLVIDAWVTMMMRAMCWGACHFFVPGERVPIEYFGSQLPVYIG